MKKIAILVVAIIFSVTAFAAITVGPNTSWILTDQSGNYIAGQNINQSHALGSITKMMTTYILLQEVKEGKVNLGDIVTITPAAAAVKGSSAYLWAGQKISLLNLIKGMLVPSGNDAAYATAQYLSNNNMPAFVKRMNVEAKKLGMTDTRYYTPDGLPPNMTGKGLDVSSVASIAKISAQLVKSSIFVSIASQKTALIDHGRITLDSVNTLLGKLKGIDGLKTGFNDEAQNNFAATTLRSGVRLIAVVFGAPTQATRNQDITDIINQGYKQIFKVHLGQYGQVISHVAVKNGKTRRVSVALGKATSLYILKGTKNQLLEKANITQNLEAPINKGQKIGTLSITYNGVFIKNVPLIAGSSVAKISGIGKFFKAITFGLL